MCYMGRKYSFKTCKIDYTKNLIDFVCLSCPCTDVLTQLMGAMVHLPVAPCVHLGRHRFHLV